MAERNSTQPQVPTVEDLWEIIEAQQELLSRYHSLTEETRLWAHGEKIELPQFARFDPEVSDRHHRLSSLVAKTYAAMVFMKTGSMPIRVSKDLLKDESVQKSTMVPVRKDVTDREKAATAFAQKMVESLNRSALQNK